MWAQETEKAYICHRECDANIPKKREEDLQGRRRASGYVRHEEKREPPTVNKPHSFIMNGWSLQERETPFYKPG